MDPRRIPLALLLAAGAGAADGCITARPASLELRQTMAPGKPATGMFTGTIALSASPGLEVIGGDAELVEAVDGAGASLLNPSYMFGGTHQRAPLSTGGIGMSSPAEIARQKPAGPLILLFFAERGPAAVVARVRVRAALVLGDGSRRVVTLGRWPEVAGAPLDLPGAPSIGCDADGRMSIAIDSTALPAWRTIWIEQDGKPVAFHGGSGDDRQGRYTMRRDGRVPQGAEVKAELTAIRGTRTVDIVLGPWSFPGNGPPPAAVDTPVEVPHAP